MAKKEEIDKIDSLAQEIEKLGGRISRKLDDLEPAYYLTTGLFSLDRIVSDHGGFPGNVCVEIFGPNSTGKTSLALQIALQAHKSSMEVYYINAERAINPSIVKSFPELNLDKIAWITPDNGEKAIDIMTHLLQTQEKILIINDSIPACIPAKVEDSSAEDSHVGSLARLFSPFMVKAKKYCNVNNNLLIQLNQERAKIGPMTKGGTDQPGGYAVKFYSDIRIKLERRYPSPEIKIGDDVVGHYIEAKAVKSRCGIPLRKAEIPLIYGKGFDTNREIVEYAIAFGVIVKKGAWLSVFKKGANTDKDVPLFKAQGVEQMAAFIKNDKEARQDIEEHIKEILT